MSRLTFVAILSRSGIGNVLEGIKSAQSVKGGFSKDL